MKKVSYYNPKLHVGFLPVRVLSYNIIQWIESIIPQLFEDLSNEIKYNELNPGIKYHIDKAPIDDVAYLDNNRIIHIHENFNAYLWCMAYSLIVIYQEAIHLPQLEGNYTGEIDYENKKISDAVKLFEYAMSLRKKYNAWDYELPNPESYNPNDASFITKINGIYVSAMTFILCHEVGHNYYQHITYEPSDLQSAKLEELDADNFAIDHFKSVSGSTPFSTLKVGAVIGICSLLFLSKDIDGGETHPNKDIRIKNLLERFDLEDDDDSWGLASLAISLWARYFNIDFDLPPSVETYKEVFYHMLEEINSKFNN